MSHIYTNIEITGTKGKKLLKKVLIDTGASFTVIDPQTISLIGAIRLKRKFKVELGNGKKVLAKIYGAEAKIGKHFGPAWLITFPGAKTVIGVETLESMGLNLGKRQIEPTRPPGLAYFYGCWN